MKKRNRILNMIPDLIHKSFWKKVGRKWDLQLAKKFRLLYPGTQTELEAMVDAYRRRQIEIILLFLFAGILLVLFIGVGSRKPASEIRIWRNNYGEGQKEESLVLENGEKITFTVGEREYGEEELEEAFQKSFQWVREQLLLENKEFGEIRSDLNFMTEVPGGFDAEWISKTPEVINHDGKVFNDDWLGETKQYVDVQLTLSYREHRKTQILHFCVKEPIRTSQEERLLKIKKLILDREQGSREEDSFVIPGHIEGVSIEQERENKMLGICILTGALFLFLFFYQKNRMKDEGEERYRQLAEDYPVLINKLVLYLGAGINLRKTFGQIVNEYIEDVKSGRMTKRYMYEELVVMVNEMNAGASEKQAYETFGYRMEQSSYMKLISLLVQNMQKGNDGLLKALEAEEANAFFLRIDYAKKQSEEAETKLLFPMLLMLLIVMAIVMTPALFQFGGIYL